MNIRIIPRLEIKGPNLVKGIRLEGLRVLGQPEKFARHYYETGADEIFYQDVVASLYDRNSLHELIKRTAKEIFIPITVGGGIRSIEDIKEVLRAGADKVSLNTAAIRNPDLIRQASNYFGSSTIVIGIEAIKQPDGEFLAYTDNGREYTGLEVVSWAMRAESLGAGEIMITSVDKEGTGQGFDYELISSVCEAVSIPVIAHGGAGKAEDIEKLITSCKVSAVAASSLFHYSLEAGDLNLLDSQAEGNIEYLKNGLKFSKVNPSGILKLKSYLNSKNIECRFKEFEPFYV